MTDGGALMLAEIREQPHAIRRLVDDLDGLVTAAEQVAAGRRTVRLVGHGSSDNAATYGVYAFGLHGWTAFRDSISLTAYYGADINLHDDAIVALSQSGETPDVVDYVARARSRGALTVAITNERDSSLARTAELVVDLHAGPERAVAATKTYVSSLAALALLAGYANGCGVEMAAHLRHTADLMEQTIERLEPEVVPIAAAFAFVSRMFVIGRGVELATARELALKLQETCRIAADALTATDFAHGPVAAVDPLFPVWAIASDDAVRATVEEATRRARLIGAGVIASGPAADTIAGAAFRLRTCAAPHAALSPLISILPGQLFARSLAVVRGFDPDAPVGLSKVTHVP